MHGTATRQSWLGALGATDSIEAGMSDQAVSQVGCRFCTRLAPRASGSTAIEQTALLESDEFVAWPSLGALVEGWMLVVTKVHHLSVLTLDSGTRRRFIAFLERTARLVEATYGPVAVVEHGPLECGSPTGCSIDHAHAHVIPWSRPLREPLSALCPAIEWHDVRDLASFVEAADPAAPYVLLSSPADGTLVGVARAFPSQLVRRAIAAGLGEPERFDWKSHPRLEVVRATVHSLQRAGPPL